MAATIFNPTVSRSVTSALSPPSTPMTFAEYIAFEQASMVKHHYYYGQVIEVAGASYEHNIISSNLQRTLGNALDDTDCQVLGSDMKVMVSPEVSYYPDVVVTCGSPLITFEEALQNPVLIAEVLSASTSAFDRGEKFRQYRTISYLRHIVFLEQDRPIIEHYERSENGEWVLRGECNSLEQTFTLTITGTLVSLPLPRIYRNVTFPEMLI